MRNFEPGKYNRYKSQWNKQDRTLHARKWADWRCRSRYGVFLSEIEQQVEKQNNKCAICEKERELVIDHCHERHRFRAMLCRACNLMIGYAHDDIEILNRAVRYLNLHDPNFKGVGSMGYQHDV